MLFLILTSVGHIRRLLQKIFSAQTIRVFLEKPEIYKKQLNNQQFSENPQV